MGLFCLPKGKKSVDYAKSSIGNLQLYIDAYYKDNDPYKSDNDYLLGFAQSQVDSAIEAHDDEYKEAK